jgi:hypothetical protein
MKTLEEKITDFLKAESCPYPTDCYAVPGSDSMIDTIHPATGLAVYSGDSFEQVQARHPGAVRMSIEAFCEAKAIRQHSPITWEPVTEDKFFEMFEVLPPAYHNNHGFLVGEPWDHDASNGQPRYAAYRMRGLVYETASRPMTIKEFKEQP